MNDTELDEMLDKWQAPPVPASLRENVRAGFSATLEKKPLRDRRTRWITKWLPGARKSMLAGAALGPTRKIRRSSCSPCPGAV